MPYVYRHFIPQNTAPAGAQRIGVYDSTGKKVCTIPLGRLTPPSGEPLYSFGLLSDIHVWNAEPTWRGNAKFDNALTLLENAGCVFCAHCGDITQTGFYTDKDKVFTSEQFEKYQEICEKHTIPVYGICGNHESITGIAITNNLSELKQYTGTDLYYTITQGNDLFVFIGQPTYNKVMGDDALAWLQTTLSDNANRRCFVFIHSYIEEDSGDAVDYRENSIFDEWGAAKTKAFMDIMRQYPNAILFHGHSHVKFECQEYDVNATYTERNGFQSVHVPSVGKPRDIILSTGETPEDNNGSQGYIVDVYGDFIVLNGWDFIGNKPVPLGVYKIDTIKVESGFPHGYTILDYVQFNKDKRYDTGIVCDQDTILEITFTREDSDAAYLYGVRNSGNTASVTAYMSNSGAWRFGNKYKNYTLTLNTVHTAKVQKSGITMDGAKTSFTSSNFTANATLLVGTSRGTSGDLASAQFIGKIYSLKLYDGSELILDWIPCINPDGITGFYDTVGNKFVSPI